MHDAEVIRDPLMLEQLFRAGHLRALDFMLAVKMAKLYGESRHDVILALALASNVTRGGHICLDLTRIAEQKWPLLDAFVYHADQEASVQVDLPSLDKWVSMLETSPLCALVTANVTDTRQTPLVLVDRERLYVRRFYQYEQNVARKLLAFATWKAPAIDQDLQEEIDRLFPVSEKRNTFPRCAAGIALTRNLLILSGGPGTGKTFTMARLLQLLAHQKKPDGTKRIIKLAAPTGKASMRMRESILKAKLPDADGKLLQLDADLPQDATTLHRLLGPVHNSPHFKHNARNPLDADVVIVDEASMIALPMMARLLDAIRPDAKLILLGDMHQLSSVEPGYVLGDICGAAIQPENPLHGTLVELTESTRFSAKGPVGLLSAAFREAGTEKDPEGEAAWHVVQNLPQSTGGHDSVTLHPTPERLTPDAKAAFTDFQQVIFDGYGAFMEANTVAAAFDALAAFRILCPLRNGPFGVENVNHLVEDILARKYVDASFASTTLPPRLAPTSTFYDHRVLMVTRNNPGMELFNGDVGIVMPAIANGEVAGAESAENLVVWFAYFDANTCERKFRSVACNMLPEHETAFAMTIHKSQGSEFTNLLLLLPPRYNPVLTKELLYTGLTRVKEKACLWCNADIYKAAATSKTVRSSGLTDALCRLDGPGKH